MTAERSLTVLMTILILSASPARLCPQSEPSSMKKKAVIRSLIVPGWGESSLGHNRRAIRIYLREAGIWLGMYLSLESSKWYSRDYRALAAEHAGVDNSGKPYLYYVNIGNYLTLADYNDEQLRRRNLAGYYQQENGYDWAWDSISNQKKFVSLRQGSDRAAKIAKFMVAGLLVNRALSAIQVLILTRGDISPAPTAIEGTPLEDGGMLTLKWSF